MRAMLVAGLISLIAAPVFADTPDNKRTITKGRELYVQYCSSCHGVAATGEGVLADAMKTKPADLTRIAERRNGRFDPEEIARIIDGRELARIHGAREMPVWGEQLGLEIPGRPKDREPYIRTKLRRIVSYLQAIQAAPKERT